METKELIKQLTVCVKSKEEHSIPRELIDELKSQLNSDLIPDTILFAETPADTNIYHYTHIHTTKDYTIGRRNFTDCGYVWMIQFNKDLVIKFKDWWTLDDDQELFTPKVIYIGSAKGKLDFNNSANYCVFNDEL